MNPAEKRLAVEVEDHALEYVDFEGIIPDGEYGAGAVVIWDEGTYELLEKTEKKISLILHGGRLRGGFVLSKLKPRGKGPAKDWLLIKKDDDCADRHWRLQLVLTEERREQLESEK